MEKLQKDPVFPKEQSIIGTLWHIKSWKKLNANDYSTEMHGIKYKIAHRRADKANWNISDKAQRKRLIKLLENMIHQLEVEDVKISQEKKKKTQPKKRKLLAVSSV